MIPPNYDIILENPVEKPEDTKATLDMLYEMPRPYTLNIYALRIIPNTQHAKDIEAKLLNENIRVSLDARSEKVGAKIRDAELNKLPVMLIVGEKEAKNKSVSIRRRYLGDLGIKTIDELISDIIDEIKTRRRH